VANFLAFGHYPFSHFIPLHFALIYVSGTANLYHIRSTISDGGGTVCNNIRY
jgi:hypothetical protein